MPYSYRFGRDVQSFLRRSARARDGGADLALMADELRSVTIYPAQRSPRAIFIFTKGDSFNLGLTPELHTPMARTRQSFIRNIELVYYPTLLTAPLASVIARASAAIGAPAYFVADLDPGALTQWLVMTRGGWNGPSSRAPSIEVAWRGVSSEWIDIILARFKHAKLWSLITMNPLERELWKWLRSQRVDWKHVIGARAIALLESGQKLELEGAMNPKIIGQRGLRDVRRWLFTEF